ncbi:rapamycin-insensitive companion of mTOR isoform X2 [Lingula anatina]|uniref:Rapamycin-insensitive companion of mTOR isoform X2 n=1 Tax=Lingula anatina TaxID=7574 RepID=A0A1S3IJW5_LINAN|nr:rapamycin-insensitive companion of mTOR isoform X2 [Lingula anatina]|eukprot:XP_013398176.1 rapamycin-insensitive companion of mTOR isoform X2 [Lingula anatina]
MAAFPYRSGPGRSFRGRSYRSRYEQEESVPLDLDRAPEKNIKDILTSLVLREGVSKGRKLGHLNNLVRLCVKLGANPQWSYSKEEVLTCLRLGLLHEAKEVRAACLRALRYLIHDKETLDAMLKLHIDYLVARSLDICLDNQIERVHALRLIRKMVQISAERFPPSLVSVMLSICNDGAQEHDETQRACLATISELAILNPRLVSDCGGISTILRNVLDCHHLPRVNESLLATVLYLLNHPRTRHYIKTDIDLEQILAPFTDCHFRYGTECSDQSSSDERDKRFEASKMAIATIMRSWPGLIRLCNPDGSGLQSLIGVLYLPKKKIRLGILDILFDVFQLTVPAWTECFVDALLSVDPSEMRDSWKLTEGFVAKEGRAVLQHTSKIRTNLVECHMAVILSALISAGVLEAIVEVITTSERKISVRATILLGELLHLANTLLPYECSEYSHCLPTLISLAASFKVSAKERQQASMAVNCLDRFHAMKKRGPVPCSLYLDQLVQHTVGAPDDSNRPLRLNKEKLMQYLSKDTEDTISQGIRDSCVLATKDNFSWNWDLIGAILKWPDEALKKLDDQTNLRYVLPPQDFPNMDYSQFDGFLQKLSLKESKKHVGKYRFIRRIVYFFKPTTKLFSNIEVTAPEAKKYSVIGCHLVDFLLDCDETEGNKLLEEWLEDIARCLSQIRAEKAPPEALFSPSRMANTLSHDYFLFIGRLSYTLRGEKALEKTGILSCLLDLVTVTSHDVYIKLVVSSLDYSRDGMARIILSKALTATSDNARYYTASFMRVLLRAKIPFFSTWGTDMLVTQMYDQDKKVALEALSVLDEACEDEVNLLALIKMRPSFLHMGEKGSLLLARFLSQPSGLKFLIDANFLDHELQKWHKTFNMRYVHIVEDHLNQALTTYEKNYDGSYTRRSSRRKIKKDVYVPIHLYGQLVQHKEGYELIEKQDYLQEYVDSIKYQELRTDEDVLKLKAAMWAVGQIGSSAWGLQMLERENLVPELIKLAEECGVFSVRGTAYYVLCLVASSRAGSDLLHEYGWESVRHNRHDLWPVIEEEDALASDTVGEETSDAISYTSSISQFSEEREHPKTPSNLQQVLETREESQERDVIEIAVPPPRPKSHSEGSMRPEVEKPRSGTCHSDQGVTARVNGNVTLEDGKEKDTGSVFSTMEPGQQSVNQSLTISHGRSASDSSDQESKQRVAKFEIGPSPVTQISPLRRAQTLQEHARQRLRNRMISKIRSSSLASTERSKSLDVSPSGRSHSSSLRDERSYSNDSTQSQASKSRSDSFNTDTTTSGVESFDSGHKVTLLDSLRHDLSPIASESSMNNKFIDVEKNIHPSDMYRKQFNLRRTPSLQRRFKSPVMQTIRTVDGKIEAQDPNAIYTTSRNAQGYLALRTLQRQRTLSSGEDSDVISLGASSLVEPEPGLPLSLSLDFRSLPQSRYQSFISLQNVPSPTNSLPRPLSRRPSNSSGKMSVTGAAQFIGLCLPVDISMIFQVSEGEDQRSQTYTFTSTTTDSTGETYSSVDWNSDSGTHSRSASQVSHVAQMDGLEHHSMESCFGCYRVRKPVEQKITVCVVEVTSEECEDEAGEIEGADDSQLSVGGTTLLRLPSKDGSYTDGTTVGSVSSDAGSEIAGPRLSEDSVSGRSMIRQEILKFIINLSSSVGVKASEQNLLNLKQKFPNAFQDLCLYSEVCYLLGHYNFRLPSRRFIQELFQDMTFDKMFEEPQVILNLNEDVKPVIPSTVEVEEQ